MQEQIPDYVMNALENGKIVGYQGRGTGRPIYEFTYNGEIHKVAITVGNNGFIVGANPKQRGMCMKVIKIKFEYGCFPVWIYGENNELIENDLPPYLIGDSDIDPKFLNIQKIYDSLYLDDGKEFKYIGFKEAEKRENFFRELLLVINLLKNKLNDEYIIEDNMDFLKKTIN